MSYRKYKNEPVAIDGISFQSQWEGELYCEYKMLERAGEIQDLVLQPRFELVPSFKHRKRTVRKMEYVADFQFIEKGKTIVVDAKSPATRSKDAYRIKRKLFLYKYGDGIEFREVCKNGEVHIY